MPTYLARTSYLICRSAIRKGKGSEIPRGWGVFGVFRQLSPILMIPDPVCIFFSFLTHTHTQTWVPHVKTSNDGAIAPPLIRR